MLSLLVLTVFAAKPQVPAQSEKPKTLFDQIVKHPTGENGYEEYIRAADAVNNDEYNELSRVVDHLAQPPDYDTEFVMPKWAEGKTRIEVERMRAGKYEAILAWIHQGNQKAIFDPRGEMNEMTLFPEFAAFKRVTRLASSVAKVHFADGDPEGAANILADQLIFTHNIRKGSLIADLVGIASQSIVLAAIEPRLDAMSQTGWNQLIDIATTQAKAETPLVAALLSEKPIQMHSPQLLLQDDGAEMGGWFSEDDGESKQVIDAFKKLSPEDRKACAEETSRIIGESIDSQVAVLRGPESKWPLASVESTPVGLAAKIADLLSSSFGQVCVAEARNRLQLRLLAVHGLIQDFRLEHDRLPRDLSELKNPEMTTDPFTKNQMGYQILGANYRLFCRGRGDIGDIELRRRPKPSDPGPLEPDVP